MSETKGKHTPEIRYIIRDGIKYRERDGQKEEDLGVTTGCEDWLWNSHEQLVAALRFYMSICGNTAYHVSRESAQEAYTLGRAALRAAGEDVE